jgi:hypothetical protein
MQNLVFLCYWFLVVTTFRVKKRTSLTKVCRRQHRKSISSFLEIIHCLKWVFTNFRYVLIHYFTLILPNKFYFLLFLYHVFKFAIKVVFVPFLFSQFDFQNFILLFWYFVSHWHQLLMFLGFISWALGLFFLANSTIKLIILSLSFWFKLLFHELTICACSYINVSFPNKELLSWIFYRTWRISFS